MNLDHNLNECRAEIVTHLSAMRAFAISLTRDETLADDMVQDTVIKAWTSIEKFTPGTNMRAWLFTILRNTVYSHHRKRRHEVPDSDGIFAMQLSTKPNHDGRLQLRDFEKAFAQLPFAQQETLILLGGSGYSYDEAAEICGVPSGTIKSRANRGRRQLAILMGLGQDGAVPLTDVAILAVVGA